MNSTQSLSSNDERKLAVVERITAVSPIPDADAIERVQVRGWSVVAKKGQFKPGDLAVYVEIDALMPVTDPRFAFLAPRGVRTDALGRSGHVVRTAKLRGVYSQGIVFSIGEFPELASVPVGTDVTPRLGIVKYERPIPASLEGEVVGDFPGHLARKTDAERVQNLDAAAWAAVQRHRWIATEKVDGSSMTVLRDPEGNVRTCSRNLELRESASNTLWMLARRDVAEHLQAEEVAQGEAFGEGIQGNPLKVRGQRLGLFAFWRGRKLIAREEWPEWARRLAVPVFDLTLPDTVDAAVEQADRLDSRVTPGRAAEGIVWTSADAIALPELDDRAWFKVISNRYLVKQGE